MNEENKYRPWDKPKTESDRKLRIIWLHLDEEIRHVKGKLFLVQKDIDEIAENILQAIERRESYSNPILTTIKTTKP